MRYAKVHIIWWRNKAWTKDILRINIEVWDFWIANAVY